MEHLIEHPEIPHGKIRICFTPDEEVGKGAHLFDVNKFGAEWAYTMDGSEIGELEYENFNAASAKIVIKGKSVHPGYAKNKMVNSILIGNEFASKLPQLTFLKKRKDWKGFTTFTVAKEGLKKPYWNTLSETTTLRNLKNARQH